MSGAPPSNLAVVPVQGQSFTKALHIRTPENSAVNPWEIRARCFNTSAVQQGDTIIVSFWMRTTSAKNGIGYTTFVFEQNSSPYAKAVQRTVNSGANWQLFQFPFTMTATYGAPKTDGYNLSFWVTFDPQEIEIGGLSVLDYGQNVNLGSLNLPGWPYQGHEPDAAWRSEADRRIDKYRRGDIIVSARDDQGRPLANVPVKIRMKRHAFGFGTAVAGATLRDNATYRDIFLKSFNKAVLENDLKWPFWETWARPTADFALPWFQQNGITMVRGHNIIWPNRSNLPSDVQAMLDGQQNDALRKRISDHISQIMTYTRGRVTEWDVLNEPYTSTDVQKVLGDAEMAEWFKQARAADPTVKLYINDYDITEGGGSNFKHQQALEDITRSILNHGGPIDGIGLQSHFDNNLTAPETVWAILDRYARFGKELQVTEFDVVAGDQQIEADYTRDYLTACFAHPSVSGFMLWGFWEGAHWRPAAALWTKDWTLKPNGQAWLQRIYQDWWTNVDGVTGSDGTLLTRGFLGDYDVELNINGAAHTIPLTVGKEPSVASVGALPTGALNSSGVVNAASYQADSVSPGSIVTLFGSGIGPQQLSVASYDADGQLPVYLSGARVLFDGKPAPMIYAANGQISAVVPAAVSGTTQVQVEWLGVKTASVSVPVHAASPGIFTADSSGRGQARAFNIATDGTTTPNSVNQPALKGQYLTFFLTGQGNVTPNPGDGVLPSASSIPAPSQPLSVSVGGVAAAASDVWTGLIYAGVLQVNVRIPDTAPSGANVPLTVNVGDASSPGAVTVAIR